MFGGGLVFAHVMFCTFATIQLSGCSWAKNVDASYPHSKALETARAMNKSRPQVYSGYVSLLSIALS